MSQNFRPLTAEELADFEKTTTEQAPPPSTTEEIAPLVLSRDLPREEESIVAQPILGTEKLKDPFPVTQKQTAGYAVRMQRAVEQMEALEDSGFNPVNIKDALLIENAPFIPEIAENYLQSSQYQQYQRAMTDFIMAQLRDESGAAISAGEFPLMYEIYIPVPGEGPEVIKAKREARRAALSAMKAAAGKAFDRAYEEIQGGPSGQRPTPDQALEVLLERAKNDPELAEKLRNRGLIPR